MNTSTLPMPVRRQGLRTAVGTMLKRAGGFMEKLWSLSGRVSIPAAVSSREIAHLPRGLVLALERTDGIARLEMTGGLVWVTGTPARGDVILHPGEVFEFGDRWPYVMEALTDAEFVAHGADTTDRPSVSSAI